MAETPSALQAEAEKLERKHLENPAGRYFVPLANAYRKLGELELAEERLREGLRKHPGYLSAHIVLGRVLADRGASREAAEEFRYVLSVDPQNLIALRTLGELAMAEGRTEEAGRWYRELLGVDPMNDEARQALSELDSRAAAPAEELEGIEVAGTAEGATVGAMTVDAAAVDTVTVATGGEEELEGGSWWTRPEEEPSSAAAAALEGVAHGPMDDWVGPLAGLDEAPPAPEMGQPYSGGTNGEFRIGGPVGAEPLTDFDTEFSFGAVGGYAAEPAEGEGGEDDSEFVTETIAELYARQGFYDRAADVYRELIRQRGADEGLERRLAEVERLGAGLPPLEAGTDDEVAPAESPAELSAVELPLLEDLGLGAFEDETGAEAEPLALEAVQVDDAFAASFAEGFGDSGEEPGEEVEAPAPPAGATVAAVLGEMLAWRAPLPRAEAEPEVVTDLEPVAELEPASELESGAEPTSFSFDEYFDAASEPAAAEIAEPEPIAEPAPAAPAPAAPAEEEEDLESFQAWLRTLKR